MLNMFLMTIKASQTLRQVFIYFIIYYFFYLYITDHNNSHLKVPYIVQ